MQSVLQNDTSNSDNSLAVYKIHCGFFLAYMYFSKLNKNTKYKTIQNSSYLG